ncbi:hypothetical protein GTZ78_01050 [Streptomyces sp. SID8361]|nr:hypothetical protein [Streptomyces sp. SID8361]MYX59515.1 hypothetical protein [Streptomyces sp. SID8382]
MGASSRMAAAQLALHVIGLLGDRLGPGAACRGARALRRIVLPQAMRVITPPVGNETISSPASDTWPSRPC